MLFTTPVGFSEALSSREVKALLPNELSSRELGAIRPEVRERAAFSARVANAEFVTEFDTLTRAILNPRRVTRSDGTEATEGMDYATARLKLKEYLDRTGYTAAPGEEGTITDLRSDRRLNLILETNTQMAQGYGGWKQGQNPAVLEVWPAAELYRAEERQEKRDWIVRWLSAAGEVDDAKAGAALRRFGRMIARKDSAIWTRLGPFQLPYAPFDFGSGMDQRDVERATAVAVGVVTERTKVKPQTRGFNETLQASVPARTEEMRRAIIEDLRELGEYEFAGDVLRKRPQQEGTERTETTPPIEAKAEGRRLKDERRAPQNPVSGALQVLRRKPSSLEETKRVIDQVHDDGVLPRIPVDGFTGAQHAGEYRYAVSSGRAMSMGVRLRPGEELTFLHEIGHFLDHQALGNPGSYASERSPALKAWRNAVRETEAFKTISQQAREKTNPQLARHFEYLQSTVELWARSYAQWMTQKIIARGIGSAEFRQALVQELRKRLENPFAGQWEPEDFAPVSAAIDELMREKGWLL